ncbi:tRNAHis guanylyltransferase, putative [Plasmodium gallinaceum]|uniref:tRNA(His) guanylyltransferase n=1 Tax=Plasmodium gallinaceum TaxID=5849 RepID=A0A1J1GPU9_PLAGA|nr:tRNAHis guanylyltransferase, putative [Plasmodium gallinaceum]CRG94445.1 tRNAHis guanylyltransferase, putative [Plasmodium gallinaceum]
MANSKFSYVKLYEEEKKILFNCFFVLRIDGCDFKNFIKDHEYNKPNDIKGLNLMNECAIEVLKKFSEIDLCYGHSDEYSFLFRKTTKLWNRRYNKILSNVVSYFTSSFVHKWKNFFKKDLVYLPCFDARIITYPSEKEIKDYFSWRQVDCHINTQYNECFWNLILKDNYTNEEAHKFLLTTQTKDKNELLFTRFNINYNNIPEIFRRGTIIIRNKNFQKKITPNIKFNKEFDNTTKLDQHQSIKDNCNINTSVHFKDNFNLYSNENIVDNSDMKFNQELNDNLSKFIISHENLISEKFWNKYSYIFKTKEKKEEQQS